MNPIHKSTNSQSDCNQIRTSKKNNIDIQREQITTFALSYLQALRWGPEFVKQRGITYQNKIAVICPGISFYCEVAPLGNINEFTSTIADYNLEECTLVPELNPNYMYCLNDFICWISGKKDDEYFLSRIEQGIACMSCNEFVYLVLYQSGVIKKEDIQKIYFTYLANFFVINEENSQKRTKLINKKLYKNPSFPLNYFYSKTLLKGNEDLIKSGDFISYVNKKTVDHVSIYIGKGRTISLSRTFYTQKERKIPDSKVKIVYIKDIIQYINKNKAEKKYRLLKLKDFLEKINKVKELTVDFKNVSLAEQLDDFHKENFPMKETEPWDLGKSKLFL